MNDKQVAAWLRAGREDRNPVPVAKRSKAQRVNAKLRALIRRARAGLI